MKLHDIFEDSPVIDQQQGLGAVPNNQDIGYLGLEGYVKPSDFLKLAQHLSKNTKEEQIVDKISEYMRDGGAIASPYLYVDISTPPYRIVSHDGRHRMMAVQEVYGDSPILCHLFFNKGIKRKDIDQKTVHALNDQIISQNDEIISKHWFTPKSELTEDCVVEANRAFSGIRLDEIPQKYKHLKVLGRGTTSIALQKTEDTVIILTRDSIKKDWLVHCYGINLAKHLETIDSNRHHIKEINELPIYVLEMPKLLPLNQPNKKVVKELMDEFDEIRNTALCHCKNEDEFKRTVICHYQKLFNKFDDKFEFTHQLEQLINFLENYDPCMYNFDLSPRNFRQTVDGRLVVLDPIVDKHLMDIYANHRKANG